MPKNGDFLEFMSRILEILPQMEKIMKKVSISSKVLYNKDIYNNKQGDETLAEIIQRNIFSWQDIEAKSDLEILKLVLGALPDEPLMRKLELDRKGRRDDYPIRPLWNAVVAGVVYQHPSIASLLRELRRNGELRSLCGFDPLKGSDAVPGDWVMSRFLTKLIENKDLIEAMFDDLVEKLKELLDDYGVHLAIDGKHVETHARPRRDPSESSDPDANWGVKTYRGVREDGTSWEKVKSWFGYKLHLIVDSKHELPVAYKVTKASISDTTQLLPMVEAMNQKHPEIVERCQDASGDKGYDSTPNLVELKDNYGINPIIDKRDMWNEERYDPIKTRPVFCDRADNIVYDQAGVVFCIPESDMYRIDQTPRKMALCGYEEDRKCLKYRCPAAVYGTYCPARGNCGGVKSKYGRIVRVPLETDLRIFTPVARPSLKFKRLYKMRSAVERVNYRLDRVFNFEEHFIRGKAKMEVRIGLAMIVMLAIAVGQLQANRKSEIRKLATAA